MTEKLLTGMLYLNTNKSWVEVHLKWRGGPDMTIVVDWVVKQGIKQSKFSLEMAGISLGKELCINYIKAMGIKSSDF